MEAKIVYFETPGKENTDEALRIVKKRADELGIKTVVIASNSGDTAVKAVEILKGIRVVAVGLATGTRGADVQLFTQENRSIVERSGGVVLTTTNAFSGVSRAVQSKYNTDSIPDIIANTLRIFGSGIKVICEITMMAADSGLVRTDEAIIGMAGTHNGSDTAVILKPVNSQNFFDFKIQEILCKPHFFYV
jgi:hypothetical protein